MSQTELDSWPLPSGEPRRSVDSHLLEARLLGRSRTIVHLRKKISTANEMINGLIYLPLFLSSPLLFVIDSGGGEKERRRRENNELLPPLKRALLSLSLLRAKLQLSDVEKDEEKS